MWRKTVAILAATCIGALAMAGAPIFSSASALDAIKHPPCCHPPPSFAAPRYYCVPFSDGTASLVTKAQETAIGDAQGYVQDSLHGARTVILARDTGRAAQRALDKERALVVASALVAAKVYPGSIQIYLTHRLPVRCADHPKAPYVAIQIGRMEADFTKP